MPAPGFDPFQFAVVIISRITSVTEMTGFAMGPQRLEAYKRTTALYTAGDALMVSVSILICTRNRADVLISTLDSVTDAAAAAPQHTYQLVVVDNNSTDNTQAALAIWLAKDRSARLSITTVLEKKAGLAAARNTALSHAVGDIIVFTDDDCTLTSDYFSQLAAHYEGIDRPTIRGGRVELGDERDLPYTIKIEDRREVLGRNGNPSGFINGCNMTMSRDAFLRTGMFDERFGAGALFRSAEDTDYLYRAVLAGVLVEYVPDMTVYHFHGRRHERQIKKLYAGYHFGNGALYAKYLLKNPAIAKNFYWDLRNGLKATFRREPVSKVGMRLREVLAGNIGGFLAYVGERCTSGLSSAARRRNSSL